jgi:prevent-host-death family protein
MIVNVHKAKSDLSRLIERAEAGEDVVIARNGKPAVRLTPVEASPRKTPEEILESFWQLNASLEDRSPPGWSHVDAFNAERRLEGLWENEKVTNAERRAWLDRLERFEVWPADLEAFVAERAAQS